MQSPEKIYSPTEADSSEQRVLELIVNNHPGVMSHICGLFSRRAYNMEGIFCIPVGDGKTSRIWIRIADSGKFDQIVKQLGKLEDVISVESRPTDNEVFAEVEKYFGAS